MRLVCSYFFVLLLAITEVSCQQKENDSKITLGAYYFDGWTGKTIHISTNLKDSFPERKPVWGWVTSTPEIIEKQIDLAAEAGIDFFSFCWYYNGKDSYGLSNDLKNNALNLYMNANNKKKIKFSLLVANHGGYIIKPAHWDSLTVIWSGFFLDSQYVKANGSPLITFFDIKSMIQKFGSTAEVRKALERLKAYNIKNGLKGVSIAACIHSGEAKDIELAKECGFDIFTGYNYHKAGYSGNKTNLPINDLISGENTLRRNFVGHKLQCIPIATINWDDRPYISKKSNNPVYVGFSEKSVYKSVKSLRDWTIKNKQSITEERIAVIYAWNEYIEGAWLTPTEKLNNSLLRAVKKGLN